MTPAHLAEATDLVALATGGMAAPDSKAVLAVASALASRDSEIARVRGERDEAVRERDWLRLKVEQLCALREQVAMLVPTGECAGTVEEDIAAYVERLTASLARLREENGRLKGEREKLGRAAFRFLGDASHENRVKLLVCLTTFSPTNPGAHTETE